MNGWRELPRRWRAWFTACFAFWVCLMLAVMAASCAVPRNGQPSTPTAISADYVDHGNHIVCYRTTMFYAVAVSCVHLQAGDQDY